MSADFACSRYDELELLKGIEARLAHKVAPLGEGYSTPPDWAAARAGEGAEDAAVIYGRRVGGTINAEAAARQARCADIPFHTGNYSHLHIG